MAPDSMNCAHCFDWLWMLLTTANDTIELAYPRYVNVLEPVICKLLPVIDLDEILEQINSQVGE